MTRCMLLSACLLAACATDPPTGPARTGPCEAGVVAVPLAPGIHHAPGTPLSWPTNPPATGDHYVIWAPWYQTYIDPVLARGYWLHNAEHGGVVLLFNCPAGCPDDVAALEAFTASLPVDPRCVPPIRNRTVIAADPLLPADVRIAAVTWGYIYTASCVDDASLTEFANAHYGMSTESTCADPIAGSAVDGPDTSPR